MGRFIAHNKRGASCCAIIGNEKNPLSSALDSPHSARVVARKEIISALATKVKIGFARSAFYALMGFRAQRIN